MNGTLPIEGNWSIHGPAQPAVLGKLAFESGDRLSLTLNYPSLSPSPLGLLGDLQLPEVLPAVHGIDVHGNPVTLFGCTSAGIDRKLMSATVRLDCLAALQGAHLDSWRAPAFRAAQLHYSHLHHWMGRHFYHSDAKSTGRPDISLTLPEEVTFPLVDGILLRVSPGFSHHSSLKRINFEFDHTILFHFPEPLSIPAIRNCYARPFKALLSLLTGEVVQSYATNFFIEDPYTKRKQMPSGPVRLIQSTHDVTIPDKETSAAHLLTSYADVSADFGRMLAKWFASWPTLEPVVELYLAVSSGRVTSIESRFLFLAQALEAYHSRSTAFTQIETDAAAHKARLKAILAASPTEHQKWLRDKLSFSNQKTLSARIDEMLGKNDSDLRPLVSKIPKFADKVRHTRNYFTHYGEKGLKSGKVAKGAELIAIAVTLEAVVGLCLLRELGISGKPIHNFLARHSDIEVVHLDDSGATPQP